MLASLYGQCELVKLLLKHGARVDLEDNDNFIVRINNTLRLVGLIYMRTPCKGHVHVGNV